MGLLVRPLTLNQLSSIAWIAMSETKKVDSTAKPGMVPPWEALTTTQVDSGMQPAVIWSKVRAEKSEQPLARREGIIARLFCAVPRAQWTGGVWKAAEMEFPLIPLEVAITLGSKRKAKRAVEWEELVEWKPLTMTSSPLVEQLRKTFVGMEVRGASL